MLEPEHPESRGEDLPESDMDMEASNRVFDRPEIQAAIRKLRES